MKKQRIQPRDPKRLSLLAGEVLSRTFEQKQIERWQNEIHSQTLQLSRSIDQPNFSRVGHDDLARMIRMYDDRFFDGRVLPLAKAEGKFFPVPPEQQVGMEERWRRDVAALDGN